MRIDLPENYAVRQLRQSVRDSLSSHGEEVVLLHAYHVNADEGTVPRCPECYDDLYQGQEKQDCGTCYGTSFKGGIRDAYRAWAIFTDSKDEEDHDKRGVWHPVARDMHTEHFPDLWQHDFVIRVTSWTTDHRVEGVEGIYVCDAVTNESLRTGNRPGNISVDAVGQRVTLQKLSKQMSIHRYPLVGVRFDRADDATPEGVGAIELDSYEPSITYGEGPPVGLPPEPGTLYIDTLTGDMYEWDS